MEEKKSVFEVLSAVDTSGKVEEKMGLSYLSWAWAWAELMKVYPNAESKVYETDTGCPYWTDGRTCWVKVGVTVNGLERIEYFPVMDHRNQSITADKVRSTDWNTAVQRGLTKAIARHGLGLNLYANTDLPLAASDEERAEHKQKSLRSKLETMRSANNNDEDVPF